VPPPIVEVAFQNNAVAYGICSRRRRRRCASSPQMRSKVETGRALATAGLHPATGSADMLLHLFACAVVTLKAVTTAQGGLRSIEGDIDFRDTLCERMPRAGEAVARVGLGGGYASN
jgi:hypothetical protein